MITTVIVTLIVLFGAALMGKMLMDMFSGSPFGGLKNEGAEDSASID